MAGALSRFGTYFAALCGKWRFLRGKYRLALTWPIVALLVAALGWRYVLSGLDADRQELENRVSQEVRILASSYASQLSHMIDAIDQTALHVKYEWELSQGGLNLEDAKQRGLFPPSSIFYVAIIGPDGNVITGTLPRANSFVGDRMYFLMQKIAATDALYIDEPAIGRTTFRGSLFFSRRLRHPDGSFGGVVLVSVAPDYFTTSYNEAAFMQHGLLAMVGQDAIVRVSRTGPTIHPPHAQALLAAPFFPSPSGSLILNGDAWFRDRRSRYVGWQALDRYPLIALAGLDQQEVLRPYWTKRQATLHDAILASAGLAAFTLAAMALSLRLAWRKHQLEVSQTTYRMATESGNEGFYISHPIYDKHGAIIDFEVTDCNARGAELVRLRREELLGKRLSELYQEPTLTHRMDALRQAMETGSYEGEMEAPDAFAIHWMHVKAVRSNHSLAVTVRDISDTKAHVAELERRSNEDALTGLPNRHWVETSLPNTIAHAAAHDQMLALLFIDLDGFKAVNDTVGHAAGDEVLRNAARRLKEAVRPHDCVARLGGDEFVVILEQLIHQSDAAHVAERILHAFEDAFRLPQGRHAIGASIGISLYPCDGADAQTLLRNADIAMYSVKTGGKRNYRFYDERFYALLRARIEQEAELRQAVEQDQFVLYYQPRIDLHTGATASLEALVRWAHPAKGLISPLEFIPLAEETGLILRLGELVIDKVCAQLADWARSRQPLVPVSVNVSSRQFNDTDVARLLAAALARHRVDPRLVEIELTESSVMGDNPEVGKALSDIQQMGVKLLVDDFGTGYSSLSQLQRLDFDVLKVDQAFTRQLDKSEEGNVFFKAIITMAHALGMRVVAEGVESLEQIKILKSLECDEIQGFYISKPLPPSEAQPFQPRCFLPSTA